MRKNITLSVDEKLLKKARFAASQKHTTLTSIIREYLENYIRQNEVYEDAMLRMLKRFSMKPLSVGRKKWKREDLHER
ncbi:MAG: MerR family transcriptional regulator [Nitrospirae bacterium]|nr:MerR family transcriptional regulator [Nitrospirota bacterium]